MFYMMSNRIPRRKKMYYRFKSTITTISLRVISIKPDIHSAISNYSYALLHFFGEPDHEKDQNSANSDWSPLKGLTAINFETGS